MRKIFYLAFFVLLVTNLQAQKFTLDTAFTKPKNLFEKKTYWGFTFNQSFTSINVGEQPEAYFFKPSIGVGLKIDHYFSKKWGLSVGLNYQQRGAGIRVDDSDKSLGDPDSTTRFRIRFNCFELPISLLYRGKNKAFGIDWLKFNAFVGITPSYNVRTSRVYISAEDGFHNITNMTSSFYSFDVLGNGGIGFEMNGGNSCIFQLHLIGNLGFSNVYKDTAMFGDFKGQNGSWGLRLGFMF